jgi:bifunctional UDP-N-acetylglucosamine pyrophosphorylase/glucosamine-1-phosphate N-acetyltransferase
MSDQHNTSVIILAAGQGTRMKSMLPKVLHAVAGRPMLGYAMLLARQVATNTVAVVVGHGADGVRTYLEQGKSQFDPYLVVEQTQQLGTGHAVQQAYPALTQHSPQPANQYVIMCGDTPLLTTGTVSALVNYHQAEGATLTLLTTDLSDPSGYGRIIRGKDGTVCRVVEDRDASPEEKQVSEINAGTYVVGAEFLERALGQLKPQNAQGEYYLTDIIEMAVQQGKKVVAWVTDDSLETTGVNTRVHLALAEKEMRRRICERLMLAGVTILDPDRVVVDHQVTVGPDTVLHPGVILEGETHVGENCTIRANSRLTHSVLQRGVRIHDACVLEEATVEEEAVIGPMAHLRSGSVIRAKAKVGNFVELKKTEVGEGSKVNHLSYLGDTWIGQHVNVGAGTITCNYDGYRKGRTVIEDHVFIGSDVQLIAPVTIGAGALIAAGTTITEDVPADALGISRVPQTTKEGAAARRRALLDPSVLPANGKNGQAEDRSSTTPVLQKQQESP